MNKDVYVCVLYFSLVRPKCGYIAAVLKATCCSVCRDVLIGEVDKVRY